tara:strand:+ start:1424 stop:1807 length:384 start_codon:yes stop_codon:yes gene_type:complete
MIKQIPSKEIKEYAKSNPKSVLLDVRTDQEWSQDGRPDGNKIGLKSYFLSIKIGEERTLNENFVNQFKNLKIEKDHEIFTMCRGGSRSQMAAELLTREGYSCSNISDGFLGNGNEKIGWKNNQLPVK